MASFSDFSGVANLEELSEGLSEGCNEQGPWARRVYLLPWSLRWDFVKYLKGTSSSTGTTGPWIRPVPKAYPVTLPGGQIYAKDVQWVGEGATVVPSDPLEYAKARITVLWGPLDYANQTAIDDPFFLNSFSDDTAETPLLDGTTQELDYSAEYIQIPPGPAGFPDGLKIDTPMNRRICVTHLNITWDRFPRLPISTVRTYADSVNNATFLGGTRGTVMFQGVKTRRQLSPDGKLSQQIFMSLKWRKNSWNEFIRPDDGTFDEVIYNGDSTVATYPYKNFRVLLLL